MRQRYASVQAFADDVSRLLAGGRLNMANERYEKALATLLPVQRKDFRGLFETMDGYGVTQVWAVATSRSAAY